MSSNSTSSFGASDSGLFSFTGGFLEPVEGKRGPVQSRLGGPHAPTDASIDRRLREAPVPEGFMTRLWKRLEQ
ncbi:hypothetical protein [Pirellulimonas nuda]|uniref:hypothetical protein n=1 Tax=Pirellulimonas nuda TaxID=2528009 RepID=UPI0011A0E50C|nr:hypothetical protein [Pirellulimonas nuda]